MKLLSKKQNKRTVPEYILTKEVPFSVEESYRSVRTNLLFSLPEEKCKIIAFTSAKQNEGKSVTAINLAISLAKNGQKVVLIDCDLRMASVAKKLRIKQKPGLTNLLFGQNSALDVVYHHPEGIDVIPAGTLPPNPAEILGSSRMSTVLEFMKDHYDFVLLDAPPVGIVTDAAVLAPQASGVVLVVRQGLTRQEDVDNAVNKLDLAKGKILGFVLTDAKVAKKTYSSYESSYANPGK